MKLRLQCVGLVTECIPQVTGLVFFKNQSKISKLRRRKKEKKYVNIRKDPRQVRLGSNASLCISDASRRAVMRGSRI